MKIECRDPADPSALPFRTRVFYCDAGCPYQKGAIEVNHELIRRVLPKGSSFDDLTQNDVMLVTIMYGSMQNMDRLEEKKF